MQKHQGNSLLEVLLVIAVSSLLVVMAVRYFTIVDFNRRIAESISKIDILSRASYEWLAAERQPNFSVISTNALISSELVSKVDISSPWGGTFKVATGADTSHVKLSLSQLSPSACLSLRRHLLTIAYAEASKAACMRGEYYGEF